MRQKKPLNLSHPTGAGGWLGRLLAEPLLHFCLLGGALFILYYQVNDNIEVDSPNRIVVDQVQVDSLVAAFQRTWMRPPTTGELEGLISEHVKEEVLYREGLALGLDEDDVIIRRRMRQKMEFLNADLSAPPTPSDADLQAYLDVHQDSYREPARLSFVQVYLKSAGGQDDAQRRAAVLMEELATHAPAELDLDRLGDASLLPGRMQQVDAHDIGRVFGNAFAEQLAIAPLGQWSGPHVSPYGAHVVYVDERTVPRPLHLAELRAAVQRDWTAARQREGNERFYKALLGRYTVEIVRPAPVAGDALAATRQ